MQLAAVFDIEMTFNYLSNPTEMFQKLFLSAALLALGLSAATAQKISGKALLPDGKPAEFATIMLMNAADSTLAKGAVAELDGAYELPNPKAGEYYLHVSLISYDKYFSPVFNYNGGDLTLDPVKLGIQATELSTVTVAAKKPLIEVKADRTIFNVEASITAAGSNGLELLRKTPGVVIDNNENIQLRGKNGVEVYLDGKRSYMSPQELANLLKGMNASDIEAIEVITNPSAKFDASGNAGIVNIRLKKNKNFGTNGSVNLSGAYGEGPKANASLNLNHRNKAVNIFGNASGGYDEWYNSMNLYRIQNDKVFDQRQKQVSEGSPFNAKVGADLSVGTKHTFGVLANLNTNFMNRSWDSNSRTLISPAATPSSIDSILIASNLITGNNTNANFNFNYRFLDTLGNEFTFDADRGFFRSTNESFQPNFYKNADESEMLSMRAFATNTPTNIDIWTMKGDYERKLGKQKATTLGVGFKIANVKTDNTFDFFNVVDDQNVRDIEQSNHFTYTEQVNAGYVNFFTPLSAKWSLQAGLRMENTHSIGDLERDPSIPAKPEDYVERDYIDWFPSAALTYQLHPMHTLNVTYSRRIDRPSYQDLNPFEWRLDELTFRKGSPFLKPQYADSYELKYTAMQMATVSVNYSRTTDLITDIVEFDASQPNRSFINYRNLASQDNYAISIASPTPIKKWWNGYVNVTMYKSIYKANFPEYQFEAETPIAWNFYAEQTFSLPKGFTYEISGWFNSASIWGGSWLSEPQGSLDMGIQRSVFKGQGTLKLSVTDILLTAPWRSYSDAIPGLIIRGSGNWESRQIKLNFNYRFGNQNVKGARRRATGLEDESKRVKN